MAPTDLAWNGKSHPSLLRAWLHLLAPLGAIRSTLPATGSVGFSVSVKNKPFGFCQLRCRPGRDSHLQKVLHLLTKLAVWELDECTESGGPSRNQANLPPLPGTENP